MPVVASTKQRPQPRPAPSAPARAPNDERAVGRRQGVRFAVIAGGGLGALGLAMTVAVTIGSVGLAPTDVWSVVGAHLGLPVTSPGGAVDTIIWQVRVPRVLLAAVVGAGLAVAGTALQATVRNPLADPYLLGLSSGASVGAVAVIAFGVGSGLGSWSLVSAAFAGALVAGGTVVLLGTRSGATTVRIVLTGVAVGYACSALSSFLIYRAPNSQAVQSVVYWLLGSLSGASWQRLVPASVVVGLGLVVLLVLGRHLDALLAGDDTAASLGINVASLRRRVVVITSLITAAAVSVSGAIGFVGLLVPHAARFLVGATHRRLLPTAALFGALFLVVVDIGARTLASPTEIPVGIVTAAVGAPWFLYILHRRDAVAGVRR